MGVASADCAVTPGFELHAPTMLESRLSKGIRRAGCKHSDFASLWKFLAEYYQTHLADNVDGILDELLAINFLPSETAADCLTRADRLIAQMDFAKHSYSVNRVGRAIVEELAEPHSVKASPLILMLEPPPLFRYTILNFAKVNSSASFFKII